MGPGGGGVDPMLVSEVIVNEDTSKAGIVGGRCTFGMFLYLDLFARARALSRRCR